jgi:hypothetical protein
MKCDILMFRGKNRLSEDLHLMLSEGHMKKYCEFFCATAFTSRQLQFFKQTVLLQDLAVNRLMSPTARYHAEH